MWIRAAVCIVGLVCIALTSYGLGINGTVRASGVIFIAFLPLLIGLPCLCCVPGLRRPVATIGCGWALLYGAGMTMGPRSMITWSAWIFTELWLGYALRSLAWAIHYTMRGLGMILTRAGTLIMFSFIAWLGWNLYAWLERRQSLISVESPEKQD